MKYEPQYDEIRVEVYYKGFGWYPALGWRCIEEANKHQSGPFRSVDPPIKMRTKPCPICGETKQNFAEIEARWPTQKMEAA